MDAFAKDGNILLYVPKAENASVAATFDGTGKVESASVGIYGGEAQIRRLFINGKLVCQDCAPKKEYA
jgi:hypothetical protein